MRNFTFNHEANFTSHNKKVPRAPKILGKDESKKTSVLKEEPKKTSVTQSNTARLIRRKLRGCLPLSINFNLARGPPTEGVPPLATSARGPSVKRGAGLSLRSSLRRKGLPRKIAINRCQTDDRPDRKYDRSFKVSKLQMRILLKIYVPSVKRVPLTERHKINEYEM